MKRIGRMGRMVLMTAGRDGSRQDYERRGSSVESRFRDRQGREHYDNGRFAPMNEGGMWVDGRYPGGWDGQDGGRMGLPAGGVPYSQYPIHMPYIPPVYQNNQEKEGWRPMNKIGFNVSGEMDRIPPEFDREYRMDAGHRGMDEAAYRRGGDRMGGHGSGTGGTRFSKEMAHEWVQGMRNADGTTGPHWTMEKTEEARAQRGINCDPLAFWVAMNMIYSDYSKVAEKVNANSMDFYVYMAKAFLEDKDARNQGGEKLARYYEYVVM